jgi:DNA-binding transcriptional regulator YiaG
VCVGAQSDLRKIGDSYTKRRRRFSTEAATMTVTTTFTNEMISPDIVRDLRKKLGMTRAQFADEAKVSEGEVSAYEAGAPTKFVVIHEIGSALKRLGAIFPKPR